MHDFGQEYAAKLPSPSISWYYAFMDFIRDNCAIRDTTYSDSNFLYLGNCSTGRFGNVPAFICEFGTVYICVVHAHCTGWRISNDLNVELNNTGVRSPNELIFGPGIEKTFDISGFIPFL